MERHDCIRCGEYEQAPELRNGLCWDCATREDAPADPFTDHETQDLLAKFFDTDKPVLHADDPDLDRISSAAWDVLQTSNINPVTIFRVGSVPSRRTYYAGNGFELQPVSVDPSHTEVARAKDFIGELLNDFPFTSEADRLVAVAAMLGPFARSLIDGSTPLHLVEAPTPGTGKVCSPTWSRSPRRAGERRRSPRHATRRNGGSG